MADNPFLTGIDVGDNPFLQGVSMDQSPEDKAALPRQEPITWDERLKATLLFDDSPKRRAAYLKRIGYELDPKNDNKMRPLGSQGPYDMELDPGGVADVAQYFKTGKKSGLKELTLDLVEGLDSMFQGAAEEAVGQAAGVAAGAGAAAPTAGVGAIPAYAAGRSLGRATANLLLSNAKEAVGDMFLDEEIPVEYQDKLLKAAISSVAPEVITGAGKSVVSAGKKSLEALRGGFKNLLNIGGGKVSDAALDAVARDPKTFTNMDNLKNATGFLTNKISELTGLGPEDGIPRKFKDLGDNSAFKLKMSELENGRRDIVNELSGFSEANTHPNVIIGMIEQAKDSALANKPLKSKDTQALATQFDDYIDQIRNSVGDKGSINFKQLDETIKEIQKDAYSSEGSVASTLRGLGNKFNTYAKRLATKAQEARGIDTKSYADSKAAEAKIFDAFESFSKNVTPQKVMTQVIGGDKGTMTGRSTDFTKKAMTETFDKLDSALGTNISNDVKSGQLQAELFRAIESSKVPRGSGGFLTGAAAVGVPTFLATGNPAAATAAGLAGGIAATPSVGLRAVGSLSRGIEKGAGIEDALTRFQGGGGGTSSDLIRAALQGSNMEQPLTDTLRPAPQATPARNPFLEGQ